MKPMARLVFTLLVLCAAARGLTAQTIYVATGSNGTAGTLYQVDSSDGDELASVPITNANGGGLIGITGLAFNPLNGTLYGVTVRDSTAGNTVSASLVTINTTTGVATVVGSLGSNQAIGDISFAANGTLYGWEARSPFSLATINLTTGAATTVGSSGTSNTTGGGLAINPTTGNAYVSFTGAASSGPNPPDAARGTLDRVNLANGSITIGPTLTGAPNDFGGNQDNGTFNSLAFNSSGVLFGANSDQLLPANVELVTIDLVTGAVTDLFGLPENTDAIAFQLTAVPEPSTAGLILLGAIGAAVLGYYRRQR
jgi:PEP-CTERM motif-containing protein